MAKLLCALMLAAASVRAQSVVGIVTNSVTGHGLAGVKVEILQADKAVVTVTSDASGHFFVEKLDPGSYAVRYSLAGYFPDDPRGGLLPLLRSVRGEPFLVTAVGNPVKMEGHMMPFSRIAGRVVDGRGEAVPKAQLELTRPGFTMSAETDSQGKFDLHYSMFAGSYKLAAAPPQSLKLPDPDPEGGRLWNWTRTFYPGVAVAEAASKITVSIGGEVRDLELKLLAVPAHPVRGVVLNPDGTPAPKVAVVLGDGGRPFDSIRPTESKPDGTFEFPAVVDGEWGVEARTSSGDVDLRGIQWIEMRGHEMERVQLHLSTPFTVALRVAIDAPKGTPAPKAPVVRLTPHSAAGIRSAASTIQSRPDQDGGYQFVNVYPGRYSISAYVSAPYYVDAVRVGEAEVTAPEVQISGPAPITLAIKANGGTVRGTVEKCASGTVWLMPEEPVWRGSDFFRSATCDVNDRYEIGALRPGEYYAVALSYNDGPPDGSLVQAARRVTVRAGEPSTADLRVTMRPF